MVRATEAAGKTMLVNRPLTWSAAARKAKALIDDGAIGRVLEIRWRAGHMGPLGAGVSHAGVKGGAEPMTGPERGATWWHQEAAGGGAMLDFCSYGAMVSRWYLGEAAEAAMGMRANLASHYGDADDNGAMLVRFPTAMAVYEGSWTTVHHGVPTGPIVYGTEGTLVVERRGDEQVVRLEKGHGESETYPAEPLDAGRSTVAEELIHHLETGEPLHATLQPRLNLDVAAIMDAGLRSADEGKLAIVNDATWEIG
jgi:predicted dehydrogenase